MTVFRRRRSGARAGEATPDDASLAQEESEDVEDTSYDEEPPPAGRRGGPWDVTEATDDVPRLDLGGMQVPGLEGMELRVDVADDQVVAATCVMGNAALQIQPFAAPRTLGIWDDVRTEIAAGITRQGGTAQDVEGTFGTELRAQVPVQAPDGRTAFQPARFVGVDGPRWFLRGLFTGDAVTDAAAAAPLEQVFRGVVVVRGDAPMPPREPLPLRLPEEAAAAAAEAAEAAGAAGAQDRESLDPFERGPEITEVR